jgi:hypothetical protein
MIFMDFFSSFGRFNPFLGDLGPFLRSDFREKLGGCYPLLIYINQRFLEPWREVQNRKILKNC